MNRIINPFVYTRIDEQNMPQPTLPAWLNESYAQVYDDIIVENLFLAQFVRGGYIPNSIAYIEIGANHPVCTSSTYLMYRKHGLRGILVEPNPELAANLRKFRPEDVIVEAAVVASDVKEIDFYLSPENEISSAEKSFVERWKNGATGIQEKITVKTIRANQLLDMVNEAELVYLSVDVEGLDYEILCDIDYSTHRPYIIQVEPSDHFIPNNSSRIMQFMVEKDYLLICQNQTNP